MAGLFRDPFWVEWGSCGLWEGEGGGLKTKDGQNRHKRAKSTRRSVTAHSLLRKEELESLWRLESEPAVRVGVAKA